MAGFCALRPGWIEQLYIDPHYQRRGLGGAFVEMVKQGNMEMRLWTLQKNIAARRFYEARGFRLVELNEGWNNEEREPDALYVWSGDPKAAA